VQLEPLIHEIRECLPTGIIADGDLLTDRPEKYFAGEFVREAILRHTRQEVPHGIAVDIEEYREDTHATHITATIYVEKPSHKKIVIGAGGQMLKAVGIYAREELESFLQRQVVLKLWVKVAADWTQDPIKVRELVFNESL
jgi:GTP-binding protein Era